MNPNCLTFRKKIFCKFMEMWRKVFLAIIVVAISIFALTKLVSVIIGLEPIDPRNISICRTEKYAKDESFKGKLIDKFRDKRNHNYETIKVSFSEDTYESRIFVLEESGVYNGLRIGDSLFKEAGSLKMIVKRDDHISEIDLVYDCED